MSKNVNCIVDGNVPNYNDIKQLMNSKESSLKTVKRVATTLHKWSVNQGAFFNTINKAVDDYLEDLKKSSLATKKLLNGRDVMHPFKTFFENDALLLRDRVDLMEQIASKRSESLFKLSTEICNAGNALVKHTMAAKKRLDVNMENVYRQAKSAQEIRENLETLTKTNPVQKRKKREIDRLRRAETEAQEKVIFLGERTQDSYHRFVQTLHTSNQYMGRLLANSDYYLKSVTSSSVVDTVLRLPRPVHREDIVATDCDTRTIVPENEEADNAAEDLREQGKYTSDVEPESNDPSEQTAGDSNDDNDGRRNNNARRPEDKETEEQFLSAVHVPTGEVFKETENISEGMKGENKLRDGFKDTTSDWIKMRKPTTLGDNELETDATIDKCIKNEDDIEKLPFEIGDIFVGEQKANKPTRGATDVTSERGDSEKCRAKTDDESETDDARIKGTSNKNDMQEPVFETSSKSIQVDDANQSTYSSADTVSVRRNLNKTAIRSDVMSETYMDEKTINEYGMGNSSLDTMDIPARVADVTSQKISDRVPANIDASETDTYEKTREMNTTEDPSLTIILGGQSYSSISMDNTADITSKRRNLTKAPVKSEDAWESDTMDKKASNKNVTGAPSFGSLNITVHDAHRSTEGVTDTTSMRTKVARATNMSTVTDNATDEQTRNEYGIGDSSKRISLMTLNVGGDNSENSGRNDRDGLAVVEIL